MGKMGSKSKILPIRDHTKSHCDHKIYSILIMLAFSGEKHREHESIAAAPKLPTVAQPRAAAFSGYGQGSPQNPRLRQQTPPHRQ